MACSTSEIVFWSTGGIVLIVLIGIGIAEMCRKWNSSSNCGSSCNGGVAVADIDVIGDNNVVVTADDVVLSARAEPQPAVRTARHGGALDAMAEVEADTLVRASGSPDDSKKTANVALDAFLSNEAFGATDGYEFASAGTKLKGSSLRKQLTNSTSRSFMATQSDSSVGDFGMARNRGFSTSIVQQLRGSPACDGRLPPSAAANRIDPNSTIPFMVPDAFALASQAARKQN
jgi:hypothetical protein